ncbi:hypothetical protein PGRAN_01975 [Listeria grandensis FSL F6-0971]|uniref:Uncharacterized protein n=1 Tax=Listeria grandensis FSL F6-0971 TaxID=1265819 RepID=W7BIN4_9LIST|nr:hypothetical protein PGRAN_01975 [Listeria grandensis FSL F6-0971]
MLFFILFIMDKMVDTACYLTVFLIHRGSYALRKVFIFFRIIFVKIPFHLEFIVVFLNYRIIMYLFIFS